VGAGDGENFFLRINGRASDWTTIRVIIEDPDGIRERGDGGRVGGGGR